MTELLYDKDAYIKSFEATVIDCVKLDKGYKTELDKTAFFPEGGGQTGDSGYIGEIKIYDTQLENGIVYHYSDKPIEKGVRSCRIDWDKRFSRMQNHSGEHIVSGIVHNKFGYDNVSFKLDDKEVLFRFSGVLTEEEVAQIEKEANEAVFNNVKITCEYPDEEALKSLDYRSKLELTENVRIVTIEGYDKCACCAPHVRRTGEIGLIKIIDRFNEKGGTSLRIQCGKTALEDYRKRFASVLEISHLLSAKQAETASAVERLLKERDELQLKIKNLNKKMVELEAAAVSETEGNYLAFSELEGDLLRQFADCCKDKCSGYFIALNGDDEAGYRYVIASSSAEVMPFVKPANAALFGSGGGKGSMAQGKFKASKADIEKYFKEI